MSTTETEFDQLQAAMRQGGVGQTLSLLADHLLRHGRYHELFEARKMQLRQQLGLPLLYGESGEQLTDAQRRALEDGLLDACREVGLLLLRGGSIQEGWMYLRPVGETEAAAQVLREIEVDDENLEEMLQVALHEGVDLERGFALVLEHYGTCNAITTFEQVMPQRRRLEQRVAAGQLLRHLHGELIGSVRADITRQAGSPPEETSLAELVADREWLFGEGSYHVDTTHLASVVRYSRLLVDPELLRLALDLTAYGRRLHPQFQFSGEPPFEDVYPSHGRFFAAQLGQDVDEAVSYFQHQAETVDVGHYGAAAIDAYVDLLARLKRYSEAVAALIRLVPAGQTGLDVTRSTGWAPSLLQLSERAGDYQPLMDYCQQRGDLLGFAAGLARAGSGDVES